MPGVPKSGVKLELEDNILTVRGERNATVPEGMKASTASSRRSATCSACASTRRWKKTR
jgi:HSP20 family molecular chaperone IbpA